MKITDQMVRAARETFDDVSGSPLELATNDAWRAALEAALAVDGVCLVPCNLGKDGGGDTSAGRLTAFASDGEERR